MATSAKGGGTDTVNVHEAKTHLSRLLRRVADGERIVIAVRASRSPCSAPLSAPRSGASRGRGRVRGWIADDFDDTPEDLIRAFEGDASE